MLVEEGIILAIIDKLEYSKENYLLGLLITNDQRSLKHLKSCNRDMEISGQMQTLSFFPCINFLHVENGGMGIVPLQSKLNCKGRIEQSYD